MVYLSGCQLDSSVAEWSRLETISGFMKIDGWLALWISDIVHLESTTVFLVNLQHCTFLSFPEIFVDFVLNPVVFCLAWKGIINSRLPRMMKSRVEKSILSFDSGTSIRYPYWKVMDDNYETFKINKSWIMSSTSNLTSLSDQYLILKYWSLCFQSQLDYVTVIPNCFSLFEI